MTNVRKFSRMLLIAIGTVVLGSAHHVSAMEPSSTDNKVLTPQQQVISAAGNSVALTDQELAWQLVQLHKDVLKGEPGAFNALDEFIKSHEGRRAAQQAQSMKVAYRWCSLIGANGGNVCHLISAIEDDLSSALMTVDIPTEAGSGSLDENTEEMSLQSAEQPFERSNNDKQEPARGKEICVVQ